MSFLDKLFGNKSKSQPSSTEPSSTEPPSTEPSLTESPQTEQSQMPDMLSDKPRPFGYKTSWLCVKCDSSERVIEALGLKKAARSNWEFGLSQTRDRVFVSPPLDGYVLAVGYNTFGFMRSVNDELDALKAVAAKFDEVQCYASHRVSNFYAWAKFVKGELIRGYVFGEGVSLNEGKLTPEEENLGFDNIIQGDEVDWENVEFPDEENVVEIAAAWGIDPLFEDNDYPEAFGYICEK